MSATVLAGSVLLPAAPASAGAAAHVPVSHTAAAGDWPSITYDDANTSYDRLETTLTSATVSTLHPVRQGHFADHLAEGPVVVSGGRIFAACKLDGHDETIGLCAWSASSLDQLWDTTIPGNPSNLRLLASGGRLFAHSGTYAYVALDQASGVVLWQMTDPAPSWYRTPMVIGSSEVYLDSVDRLVRRSVTTGRQQSRIPVTQLPPTLANTRLVAELSGDVVVGDVAITVDQSDVLEAISLTCIQNGCAPVWRQFYYQYAEPIVYARGRLFIGGTNGIDVLSAATGQRLETLAPFTDEWEATDSVEYMEAAGDLLIASYNNTIQAWAFGKCHTVVCAPVWQANPAGLPSEGQSFVEAGGRLYTQGSWMYAVDSDEHSPFGPPSPPRHVVVTRAARPTCITTLNWTVPSQTHGLPLTTSTVTLSTGEIDVGWPDFDQLSLSPGHYTATITDNTAWGPSTSITAPFTVPACP